MIELFAMSFLALHAFAQGNDAALTVHRIEVETAETRGDVMKNRTSQRILSDRIVGGLLLAVMTLVLTLPAKAEDSATGLEKAQAKARELISQAKQDEEGGASVKMISSEKTIPLIQPQSAKVKGHAASWQGISSARLREILAKCPDQVRQDVLKSLAYANGLWTGTPPDSPTLKRCLNEEELRRLARFLKSTTYADSACKMVSGLCVRVIDYYCNDVDCRYYVEYPGSANPHQACWRNGYCYGLNYFYCNPQNCTGYPY